MTEEWIESLKVGDKVLVDNEETHIVERITPTKQIKVNGIERKFINGSLKGTMKWDSCRYLNEWTQEKEDRINAVKLRNLYINKISRANLDVLDDELLKTVSNALTKKAYSMTSIRKGDTVSYTMRYGRDIEHGCKVKSNPFIDGKAGCVVLERIGKVNVNTLKKD